MFLAFELLHFWQGTAFQASGASFPLRFQPKKIHDKPACFPDHWLPGERIMPAKKRIKSLNELVSIAANSAGIVVPSGCSHAFPVPQRTPSNIRMISFLYRAPYNIHLPNRGKAMIAVYPPHKILIQDAHTGKVIRFADCEPRDFGIDHPVDRALLESVIDFKPEGEDPFLRQKEMFMKISPEVWENYSRAGKVYAPSTAARIQEYKLLFNEVIPKPLIPYYRAVASDFLEWLDRVSP